MKSYKPNQTTILYLNSSFNCVKSSSIGVAISSGGAGYTAAPTISFINAPGDAGYGASATCTITSGAISAITMVSNGNNYNKLPTVVLTGGGSGTVTGYTSLVAGSGYRAAPNITASGGDGSGFAATATIGTQSLSSTSPIAGGTGYTSGQSIIFTGGGGSGAAGTITTASGVITSVSISNGGSGYTSAPTISFAGVGTGANLSVTLSGAGVTAITITNAGSGYTSAPTLTFTATNGGSGASATATVPTSAVLSPGIVKTYNYTWRIPDVVINSRNSFYSDYGDPIIAMVQNTSIANNDGLSNDNAVVLSPQTIRQIELSVSDSLTAMNNGVSSSFNFVIALKIEEFDPTYTEIGDVYAESAQRLKTMF